MPSSPAAAIRRRSLERNLFRLKQAVKGPDRWRRRAFSAPLTARFNRNFRIQEIDGELRRQLWFEPVK
jgi:hypothetical protein